MEHAEDHALGLAYGYLSRRERTVGETRGYLAAKGVTGVTAEGAIGALVEQGYLDDARFCRLFVQDKRALDQWGAERIRRSLLQRGIDRELVEAALGADGTAASQGALVAEGTATSELDRALDVLRGRFPGAPRDRRERDRALGVLVRKGYDPELALEALASYARDCR